MKLDMKEQMSLPPGDPVADSGLSDAFQLFSSQIQELLGGDPWLVPTLDVETHLNE